MKRTGFTLVEILIVVIILGILAAIVIPQFTQASNDARSSALLSDLQTMRSQIELYRVQHADRLPCMDATGTLDTAANLVLRLTGCTDQLGNIVAAGTAGAFGPYLQTFPTNGFVTAPNGNTIKLAAGATNPAAGDGTTGWWFNPTLGSCGPNDPVNFAR
jgi:general secretion pathway protein G